MVDALNNDRLRDGDLVLIDAGCELDCYAADITRTFPVSGTFTDAQREIYDAVRGKDFVAGQGPNGYRGNVRALIKRVRKKFRAVDDGLDPIENYPGYGYRWAVEET